MFPDIVNRSDGLVVPIPTLPVVEIYNLCVKTVPFQVAIEKSDSPFVVPNSHNGVVEFSTPFVLNATDALLLTLPLVIVKELQPVDVIVALSTKMGLVNVLFVSVAVPLTVTNPLPVFVANTNAAVTPVPNAAPPRLGMLTCFVNVILAPAFRLLSAAFAAKTDEVACVIAIFN